MEIIKNISLKGYNTFGIDVTTEYFFEVHSEKELTELIRSESIKKNDLLVLGSGSNILLTEDFKGLVIKMNIPGIQVFEENSDNIILEAGAGVIWNDFVNYCLGKNLGGVENLSLIPGTVGAAPMQNIGAYGQEIRDVFHSLEGYFVENSEKKSYFVDDCAFGYRESIFKRELKNRFIITKVRLMLKKNPIVNLSYGTVRREIEKSNLSNPTIQDVSKIIGRIRNEKLPNPVIIGNAGSFFKNPVVTLEKFKLLKKEFPDLVSFPADDGKNKIAAGWLIEMCGWKGKRINDAGVHEKQSLVLVNYGNATGAEILDLSKKIKRSVKDKFGIELKEEINIY